MSNPPTIKDDIFTQHRIEFGKILASLLGSDNVYFQPPDSYEMNYPCIVYERAMALSRYADNQAYIIRFGFSVSVIDENPDNGTIGKIMALPLSQYDRHYTANNLNHDVINVYY